MEAQKKNLNYFTFFFFVSIPPYFSASLIRIFFGIFFLSYLNKKENFVVVVKQFPFQGGVRELRKGVSRARTETQTQRTH